MQQSYGSDRPGRKQAPQLQMRLCAAALQSSCCLLVTLLVLAICTPRHAECAEGSSSAHYAVSAVQIADRAYHVHAAVICHLQHFRRLHESVVVTLCQCLRSIDDLP